MRLFVCNHCKEQSQVTELINRKPVGWSSVRVSQALSEKAARRTVDTSTKQFDLCEQCTTQLNEFMHDDTPTK